MSIRSQARAVLIHAAHLARLDALALQAQSRRVPGVVVAMHETPARLQCNFRKQLEWASRHFTITDLEDFTQLWTEPEHGNHGKSLILYTFDDGRESNYTVAAPLLESFGGRGVFFVVPGFAECADTQQALSFYRTRINPDMRPNDEDVEDWKPMSPAQIADLASRGHAIGNHTLTHERLNGLSAERLEQEIGESARKLASWTKKKIDAFAWTFGWDAIDVRAWETIRHYHRFCFSPCAGAIDPRRDEPSLLWRREIELRYSRAELGFSYSGLVDLWWQSGRKHLGEMLGAG
jgi:peptidoglycan/xylan/chitin deacetylase (PgdA/CDA1 family)